MTPDRKETGKSRRDLKDDKQAENFQHCGTNFLREPIITSNKPLYPDGLLSTAVVLCTAGVSYACFYRIDLSRTIPETGLQSKLNQGQPTRKRTITKTLFLIVNNICCTRQFYTMPWSFILSPLRISGTSASLQNPQWYVTSNAPIQNADLCCVYICPYIAHNYVHQGLHAAVFPLFTKSFMV